MQGASLQGGVIVCQHWRLRRGLGSSEGQAWEAEDIRSGNSVAIKFLQRPSTVDEPARQRFEREARAFGRVRSLHYVQILDQGISERGVPFLVTERLDGEDLGLLLARQPQLPLHQVGAILDQLLRALARLQSLRLVHRDVRPENVFLCEPEDGRRLVKLLDFGFARRPVRVASPGAWQGGAAYWSPEQIATPMRVDHRTDVWAAGVLGYRMLTGQLPFPAEDWPTLAQCVQVGKFAPVHALRPDLPAALDIWFRDMLRPQLAARFPGAESARLALERIVRACAPRPTRSGPPPLPRNRPALVRTASVSALTEAGAMNPAAAQLQEQSVASERAPSDAARLAECAPSVAPVAECASSAAAVAEDAPSAAPVAECASSALLVPESEPNESAAQNTAALATQSAAQLVSPVADDGKAAGSDPPTLLARSSVPVIAAVVERSGRTGKSTPPAPPAEAQGVRVGTLLVCGLLLALLFASVLALRPARMSGLRSQAAAAESARPVAREPSQPTVPVAPVVEARSTPRLPVAAEPQPVATEAPQLSAANPQPAAAAEPSPSLPAAAIAPISTPVAAERLRSRSAGARLSSGPASLPHMEGGPRVKRSQKSPPAPQAPAAAPEQPPPASSAPLPAANRPYRGF